MSGLGLDTGTVDLVILGDGSLARLHGPARCAGVACPVHRPSRHALRDAPLTWIPELQLMMRRCEHGHEHPDPDSLAYLVARLLAYDSWHDCCPQRCCGAETPLPAAAARVGNGAGQALTGGTAPCSGPGR